MKGVAVLAVKVATFGEIMLRLSTPGHLRFTQAQAFEVTYGGGEANVAASLAQFGVDSSFITRVPDNSLGQAAISHLRRFGVNTGHIRRGGKRLGIYFLETGASQRASQVIYDRAGSAMAEIGAEEFDWQAILRDKNWFHFTGITPALSESCAAATLAACRAAREAGVTVSCDLNYRQKLWSREEARRVMTGLMPYVDIVVANEEDAEQVFGIKAGRSDVEEGLLDMEGYRTVARRLQESFNLSHVAITLRQSHSASDNGWSGLLYDGREFYPSRSYEIRIVDRIGGGDAFAAGLIYCLLHGYTPQDTVEFAAAASCLKQTIAGDFNCVTVDEVQKLAGGAASGRVQR